MPAVEETHRFVNLLQVPMRSSVSQPWCPSPSPPLQLAHASRLLSQWKSEIYNYSTETENAEHVCSEDAELRVTVVTVTHRTKGLES